MTTATFENANLINLCSCDKTSGESVYCFLERNPKLKVLNLSSNKIQTLLSKSFKDQMEITDTTKLLGKFKAIVSLNVSDNPITDVRAMVADINLLMPNVTDL